MGFFVRLLTLEKFLPHLSFGSIFVRLARFSFPFPSGLATARLFRRLVVLSAPADVRFVRALCCQTGYMVWRFIRSFRFSRLISDESVFAATGMRACVCMIWSYALDDDDQISR